MDRYVKVVAGGTALVGSAALVAWLVRTSDPNRIKDSVGQGGANRPEDVKVVRRLLAGLGFDFAPALDLRDLYAGIRLVDAIAKQRLELGDATLINRSYPVFKLLREQSGPFWRRVEPKEEDDNVVFDPPATSNHTTMWMEDTIGNAGMWYRDYRAEHPKSSPIVVGAMSPRRGGAIDGHRGHETGLACDLRIPRKDGGVTGAQLRVDYDKQATRAQLVALHGVGVRRIVFNDKELVDEGLCEFSDSGPTPEIHVDIYWRGQAPAAR